MAVYTKHGLNNEPTIHLTKNFTIFIRRVLFIADLSSVLYYNEIWYFVKTRQLDSREVNRWWCKI